MNFNSSDLFEYASNGNTSTFPRLPVQGSNLTKEDVMDFLKRELEIIKNQHLIHAPVNQCIPINHTSSESIACQFYCNGFFKELFTSYKSMHGYISLAVSINFDWLALFLETKYVDTNKSIEIGILQICIFGTIANVLNIIVLTRKDMNKTPINTILKWLAVADMFIMIEYIPFSINMYIRPRMLNMHQSTDY